MQIKVGISKRHVHLTEEVYVKLFGDNNIRVRNELLQKGEFASESVVTIKYNDKVIENVRVVGPFREYNQVEIARSDAAVLGVNPPVRASGDLVGSEDISIIGPKTEVFLDNALIIVERHVHISPQEAESSGILNNQKLVFAIYNEKGIALDANVKYTQDGVLELHIDNDEAQEFNLKTGDVINYVF